MFNFYKPVFSSNSQFSSVSGRISTRSSWLVPAIIAVLLQFPFPWMHNPLLGNAILLMIVFMAFTRRFTISINKRQIVFKRYLLGIPYFRCTADIHTVKIAPDYIRFAPETVEISIRGKKSAHSLNTLYMVHPSANEVVEGAGLFVSNNEGDHTYTFGLKEDGVTVYSFVEKTIREFAADARYTDVAVIEEAVLR